EYHRIMKSRRLRLACVGTLLLAGLAASLQLEFDPCDPWLDQRVGYAALTLTMLLGLAIYESPGRGLQRAGQQQQDLVAEVVHDLRSPLSAVRGYVETVHHGDDRLTVAKARTYLGIALTQAARLEHLIDSMLALARLESGRLQPRTESFDVSR